mmetsp:Transcript_9886/g.36199  ORF Transcript_9886/g.36199 Transcript_9886/m.36199 type:complete len:304 (-) Transcript_9886:86-997(-)
MEARLKSFTAGAAASMGAAASTHPLDTLKVRMQLSGQGLSPLQVFTNIARTEGLNGLYTGLSASMTRQLVYSGTRFMAYDAMKDILQTPGEKNLPAYKKVIAGCSAGAIGATVGNPADLALVRMQADGKLPEHLRRNYRGISDVILRTVRQEGPLSLWRGCGPTVNRAMIVTTSQLATYDQAKELLINFGADPHATSTHLTASITSGIVASCVSNPVDLAKTRLMSMQPLPDGSMPYKGMFDVMQKMVAEEGVFSLWKGLAPTMARQCPFVIMMFLMQERIKELVGSLQLTKPAELVTPAVKM